MNTLDPDYHERLSLPEPGAAGHITRNLSGDATILLSPGDPCLLLEVEVLTTDSLQKAHRGSYITHPDGGAYVSYLVRVHPGMDEEPIRVWLTPEEVEFPPYQGARDTTEYVLQLLKKVTNYHLPSLDCRIQEAGVNLRVGGILVARITPVSHSDEAHPFWTCYGSVRRNTRGIWHLDPPASSDSPYLYHLCGTTPEKAVKVVLLYLMERELNHSFQLEDTSFQLY